ncbi:hypothetical protein FKG94_25860 [Exilibacterium tricleocarpae]|uniref:Uncharacterized protein n=1 Tax=Exilibacterium tricleocarpae TaxID=2591008 RepID=A0A545SQI8_9GAMM|nr:hypothetical protein [Exilibacterium tricleocarpae]TQV67224.1 hypothetical protein FKG94_25860 [Exilibacterium tricleocarpae]
MTKTLNINTLVMFLVSLALTYFTVSLIATSEGPSAYGIGFMFGRAMTGVLIPFAIVGIPLIIFRRGKKKFTTGAYIVWWVLFVLLSFMALFGNMLPPEG